MQMKLSHWVISGLLTSVLVITGCTQSSAPTDTASVSPAATESAELASPSAVVGDDPFQNLPRLTGEATVQLVVKGSPITIQVDGADAPITAGNFVDLVNRGVYNGLAFHRVVREPQPFVVQGGDPQGRDPNFPIDRLGTGGFIDPATSQERNIPLEIKPAEAEQPIYSKTFESEGLTEAPKLRHTRGAVAMARSTPPDSASSQFYITLSDLEFLDGSYAVFGYVTSGMEVVDQIQQGDRITSATVISGIENLKPGG
ncbi:MAG: peptidylprolyl isomerase [Cyanobacteria bacterium RM1_2_2]|nr:peptidylprolyl isomerase [Cyanobacteria bacterium RM1_2_2]